MAGCWVDRTSLPALKASAESSITPGVQLYALTGGVWADLYILLHSQQAGFQGGCIDALPLKRCHGLRVG